jgi:magnesium-transporting ATPase (P-type)
VDTYRRSGIVTGILFLVADAAGFLALFAQPFLNAPDYLTKIAANEPTVLAGALLVFVMGWADAGIGISMYPILRRHNEGLALGAAAFRIIDGVFHCLGAVLILLLATLSREFIKAGPAALAQFQGLGTLLLEGHTWVVAVGALLAWCIGAYLYYALFYKMRLVPRWLSVWGLVGITLTATASILVLFRRVAPFSTAQLLMNLPIAPQEIVLAIWLIIRGFNPSASPRRGVHGSAVPQRRAS